MKAPRLLPGLLCAIVAAKLFAGTFEEHRSFLSRIQSPEDLVLPRFPKEYSAPVTLSGPVAAEMRRTIAELDIEQPRYVERFDGKRFQLVLANENYASETRDLLAGILNPVEMIEVVLGSIVRYRQRDKLADMLQETSLSRRLETQNGTRVYVVDFKPTGKRFSYAYEDKGAFVRESWLTSISLVVDSASMIARELELVKYSRTFRADDTRKPKAKSQRQRYVFSYVHFEGAPVPAELSVYIDSVRTLTISASYRIHNDHVLFDTRRICYNTPGQTQSCLDMKYGAYKADAVALILKATRNSGGSRAREIKAAAELTRKASETLKEGRIDTAVRILRTLAQNYPDTPQAVEARRMLEGLPEPR